jgi:hypothetical protein
VVQLEVHSGGVYREGAYRKGVCQDEAPWKVVQLEFRPQRVDLEEVPPKLHLERVHLKEVEPDERRAKG